MGDGRRMAAVSGLPQKDIADRRTIFEGTRKPSRTWFLAMWFVTSQKNGVSALGLQRELGLGSYETAWTWLHKLRRAMVRPGRDLLSGTIEVDENLCWWSGTGYMRPRNREQGHRRHSSREERPGAWPHPPSPDRRCLDR